MITVEEYKKALAVVNEFHSQLDPTKRLTHETIKVGMTVIDSDGDIGTVTDCRDVHNIQVKYGEDGLGLICLDPNCEEDENSFLIEICSE